jgi:hypothetical protein
MRISAYALLGFICLSAAASSCTPAVKTGRTWYVAPVGRPSQDGTRDRPLDLATALSARSPARPGDTVWLRAGVYAGSFTSLLTGTAQAPIVVRQYPGERATLDGRGAPAHTLTIRGAYTWFWGFEVTNSDPTRVYTRRVNLDPDRPDGVRGTGVNIFGPGTKCINLAVHDTLGIGLWEPAVDAEIYGTLTYNNGVLDAARGEGHGIYIQNRRGTKRIEDVISFGNYATGMKAYGESGYAEGVQFEGVTSFNNGVASLTGTPLDKMENLFVGTTDNPAARIGVSNSMFYHLPNVLASNVTLGYQNRHNETLDLQNNLIMGGSVTLAVQHWRLVVMNGNTLYATTSNNPNSDQTLAHLRLPENGTARWTRNQYFDGTAEQHAFTFSRGDRHPASGNLTFDQWSSESGLDTASSYRAGRPSGMVVRLRPNRYEPGRANLVIYNWDLLPAAWVDLGAAGLDTGDHFEIRDSQNYFGAPIVKATYTGAQVLVPLTSTLAAEPVGIPRFPVVHTAPEFNAFVVQKLAAVGP